jgi:hypothetical protein
LPAGFWEATPPDRHGLPPLFGINFSIDRRRLGNPGHGEFRIFAIRQRSRLGRGQAGQEGCGEESFLELWFHDFWFGGILFMGNENATRV